ncbi:MAG: hypothetical protein II487_02995 [Schwartzia sp.]|nr:hypothetical protein [Schwartzia sp. (in: firmicutes)]
MSVPPGLPALTAAELLPFNSRLLFERSTTVLAAGVFGKGFGVFDTSKVMSTAECLYAILRKTYHAGNRGIPVTEAA